MLCGGIRKTTCFAVLAIVCAAGAAPSAGAASRQSRAAASDFEQPLAGTVLRVASASPERSGAHEEGPVRFRSEPIRAPRRFDLVGVARFRADLEYRTRRGGSSWSEWVEAADGSPVWAGGADYVQIRSRGRRIEGRLHYVNVTAPAQASATRRKRSASGTLSYVPRSAWGADRKRGGCPPRVRPSYGSVKLAAIHHTVSTNTYTAQMAPAVVLGICRYHRNANGWNDIGYNALVDRFGVLYEGRAGGINRAVIGAHAGDWNSRVTGVALIGNHVELPPSSVAVSKLVKYLAWKLATHGLTRATGGRRIRSAGGPLNRYPRGARPWLHYVLTHRHLNSTSCAGEGTEGLLKRIRQRIQHRLDSWGGEPPRIVPTEGPAPAPTPQPPTDDDEDGGISPR